MEVEEEGQKVYKHGDFRETFEDGKKRYTCNVCSKSFKQQQLFAQHYKHVHLKKRPDLRSCHLCDIKVKQHKRPFHMEECHGVPAPSCGACGKKFAQISQVLKHQKFYHMGESKYRCEQCNMRFFTSDKLKLHMVKHQPDKPFECDICQKAFKRKKSLQTHIMIHTGARPVVCLVCQAAFTQHSSLKYHMTKRHPNAV